MFRKYGLIEYKDGGPSLGSFKNFQWVKKGKLARSSQPGYTGDDSPHTVTDADIALLKQKKIHCIISANHCRMRDDGKAKLKSAGIMFFHFKVGDFKGATVPQLVTAYNYIDLFSTTGAVLIYCGHGEGRTGMFASAWAIRHLQFNKTLVTQNMCTLSALESFFGVEEQCQADAVRKAAGFLPEGLTPEPPPLPPGKPVFKPSAPPVPPSKPIFTPKAPPVPPSKPVLKPLTPPPVPPGKPVLKSAPPLPPGKPTSPGKLPFRICSKDPKPTLNIANFSYGDDSPPPAPPLNIRSRPPRLSSSSVPTQMSFRGKPSLGYHDDDNVEF